MLMIRKHRTGLAVLSALLLAAGIAASKLHAQSDADPTCKTTFVKVTSDAPACGFALSGTGTFTLDGQTLADPLVASYEDSGGGQKAIAARQMMLFPPSPSGRFRIVQACDGTGADALCWQTLVLDRDKAKLQNIFAGRYGPEQWQSWSPDEQHVALVNKSEEASWLHVIDPESGNSQDFPGDDSTENWTIEPQTLRWTGPRSFTVTVKTCEQCVAARKEIAF
ncbi:hypothetical protein ATN84_24495 [Paramesorhizobium deserti]|uniref:Uncharacterized protein n=1 Tax=Paramesorhizobium deserti TaxID=1494590 RepID=A0A135HXP4_9HYPH|nr:hypothetical protein [Paramesorhizobium deserti]KXF77974.1 hypothetical protein ATN84_24495 [Paramesorhizobium deserti]